MSRMSFDSVLDKIRNRMSGLELTRLIAEQSALHEPINGWWDGDNNLGVLMPIDLNPLASDPYRQNRSSGFKMPSTGFPCMWTVALAPQFNQQVVGGAPLDSEFEILADITFGTGGSSRTTTINVFNGTTISGIANSIEVYAYFDPLYIGEGNPQSMRLAVNVGRYATLNPMAERHIQSSVANGGTSSRVHYPDFTRRVSLLPANNTTSTALFNAGNFLQFTIASGGSPIYASYNLAGANPTTQFPVPPRARAVQLVNGSGSDLTWYNAFHIGF